MQLRLAPYWSDSVAISRRRGFPRHRGHIDTAVAVVGGGFTGVACACVFASAGVPVVLLEGARIGAGGAALDGGLLRHDFDASFQQTASAAGLRHARLMWQAMRRSALDLEAALRRLGIRCDLTRQDLLQVAPADPAAVRRLRREYDARRAAGLDEYRWMAASSIARAAAIESGGGIRARAGVLDPYRACIALARAAEAGGAVLFEGNPVIRIRASGRAVALATEHGTVAAESVIVTAGSSVRDLRPLRRHLQPRHAYAVVTDTLPAPVRRLVGTRTLSIRDTADPPHLVRWLRGDRVLVTGAAQAPVPAHPADQTVVQRTGQLMYELSLLYPAISGVRPAWGWTVPLEGTVDGLPCIGTHRHFPRHLFALGTGPHGPAASWLAARALLRHFLGDPAKGDEVLGFSRIL